jgi:general secretion pathway protein K
MGALVAIVASVAASERVALDQQIYHQQMLRARLAAEAGIQRAVEVLSDEGASGTTTSTTSSATSGSNANLPGATTLLDDWAALGSTGSDNFKLKDSSFRMQIIDACTRVNLNTAAQSQFQYLPLSQEQIDAILDWRSTGETPRADGAKDSYYNSLPNPYDASLQNFSTVSELLDVRYFTPADLYDPPQNDPLAGQQLQDFTDGRTPTLAEMLTVDSRSPAVNQQGTAKTALSSVSLQALRRSPQFSPIATALYAARTQTTWAAVIGRVPTMTTGQLRSLLNTYYVGSSTQAGKINVNTASATVLETVPGITSAIASNLVNQQTTGTTQLGNVLNISGLTSVRSVRTIIDNLSVNSGTFIVRVIGSAGKATVPLEAILNVTAGTSGQYSTVKIVRIEEQPFNDMTGRWGWQSQTNNDIELEASS